MRIHIFLLGLVVLAGCVQFTDVDGTPLLLKIDDSGYYLEKIITEYSVPAYSLSALVKGSIYETGEIVSVFGTCLDGDDAPASDAVAYLSAWYPNGTKFLNSTNMTEIQDSYFLYTGPMSAVQGTYLTQMRCYDPVVNATALAFGEWQNPYWVNRIGDIDNATANLSVQIGDFEINVNNSFEIVFDKIDSVNVTINETFTNITQQIHEVIQVANGSVDRNDSYLAWLLQLIYNGSNPAVSGAALYWVESADNVIYADDWYIEVDVYANATEKRVTFPDVMCYINTTQTPIAVDMDPKANGFEYDEYITIKGGGAFDWNIECVWL